MLDPPGSIGIAATHAMSITDMPIGIATESRNSEYSMSLRAVRGCIDLNRSLRRIAPILGGSGGGHPEASGAVIPKRKLGELINKLNDELRSLKCEQHTS